VLLFENIEDRNAGNIARSKANNASTEIEGRRDFIPLWLLP